MKRVFLALLLAASVPACVSSDPITRSNPPAQSPQVRDVFDLDGKPVDPLADSHAKATVLLFVRTDCPISNRYAPELNRLQKEFQSSGVAFWLVYPDPDTTPAAIRTHLADFKLQIAPLRDPAHSLVQVSHASVTPEAAVFLPGRDEVYHGRIDDHFVDFGKERPEPRTHDLEAALKNVLAGKPVRKAMPAVGCYISDLR